MPTLCFRVSVATAKLTVMLTNPKELEILMNVCVWILVKCTSDQKLIGNIESKK